MGIATRMNMEGMDPRDQAELQQFVQQKQLESTSHSMISTLNLMCFEKCIDKPSAKLSSYEKDCVKNCALRFMDTQKQIVERFQTQGQGLQTELEAIKNQNQRENTPQNCAK